LILPASALAAGETLAVTPTNTQAGGSTPVTASLTFAGGVTPQTVVTSLAPGTLGNLNANPSCLASAQLTAACQIGTASVNTTGNTSGNTIPPLISGTLYLVPGQNGDAAGIDFVTALPPTTQYIGVSPNLKAPGGLNLTTTFPNLAPFAITAFTANFTTVGGHPFTRLPSSCSAATSTASVTYYGGTTGSASGSFTPTGCGSLPYAPTLAVSETKDARDNGATLGFDITQAANEAASKTIVLKLPKGLGVNVAADVTCLTGTGPGCVVGTASATSPLIPSAALAKGTVTLSGSASSPTVTVSFPAPFAITLVGNVSLSGGTVTIANVPDVPLTSLSLTITGPNGQKAFTTSCTPSSTTGTFTAQSGATQTVTTQVRLVDCQAKPTASGSASGLATGHAKLRLKASQGNGAPGIASLSVGLPTGLKFARAGIVTSKKCVTKHRTKKCTTTTLIKGLGVSGASVKAVALKGGKLVVTLKKAAGGVTVNLSGPILTESASLANRVKKHKVKSLTVTLKVTDAAHTSTLVALKLTAH
jgi:hypothetical protein